ncbi:unnamed protein product [Symbiodinium sp. CCMP2592]|nr:unnamed protein product [Symbiodinium sp. CCMP2592]
MSRPPATSRKVGRVVVLLVLFLLCLPEPKTRDLNSVRSVPEQLQASKADSAGFAWTGGRAPSKADGTLDGGEAEDHEDVKGSREDDNETKAPKGKDDVEEAKASFDEAEDKTVDEAASAQTADPVEDAKQDLDAAKRQRDVALRGLERAEALAAYLQDQLLGLKDSSSEKAKEVEAKLEKAEEKVEKAERKVETAKQEVEKVKEAAKEAAKASVQAGRVQAGASAGAVVAVAFDLHSRMVVVHANLVALCVLC